eukprot:gene1852-1131_t
MDSLYNWNDMTKIGVGLTGLGIFFFGLGIVMLLDSVLLTMGNLLFIAGIAVVMGPKRFTNFFRLRMRASTFFFAGVFFVLMRWCWLGLMLQGFGALNLFGNFIPMVLRVLESMPLIGSFMSSPAMQSILRSLQLDTRTGRNV